MANLLYLNQFITTTLSVVGGIDGSQTTSIVVQSTTGLDTTKPGIACLSYADPLDMDNAEFIEYSSINSTTNEFMGVTRGSEGYTAKPHDNGVTVAFPVSESHVNRLANALSIGGVATNGVTTTLDEDDMASDSATALVTQQSIKAYVDNNPYGGWLTTGISGVTVTRESTDNPTVVLRFDADVRDYIWKGMRIKATENSIVHYFIVSADPTDDSGDTLVTCLSEIDTSTPTQAKNLIGATTISDVAYAPPRTCPKGFPISPESWTVSLTLTESIQQSSPSQNTVYNLGSQSISVPIGVWKLAINAAASAQRTGASLGTLRLGLSAANNTITNPDLVGSIGAEGASGALFIIGDIYREKGLSLASKTPYYLVAVTNINLANMGLFVVNAAGSYAVIRATSTLL